MSSEYLPTRELLVQIDERLARVEEILNKRQEGPGCWANAPGMTLPPEIMDNILDRCGTTMMQFPPKRFGYPVMLAAARQGTELILEFSVAGFTCRRSLVADGPLH